MIVDEIFVFMPIRLKDASESHRAMILCPVFGLGPVFLACLFLITTRSAEWTLTITANDFCFNLVFVVNSVSLLQKLLIEFLLSFFRFFCSITFSSELFLKQAQEVTDLISFFPIVIGITFQFTEIVHLMLLAELFGSLSLNFKDFVIIHCLTSWQRGGGGGGWILGEQTTA